MIPETLSSYYAGALRKVSRRPFWAFAFALSSGMHALGHAGLALAAGALAAALAGSSGVSATRSIPLDVPGSATDKAIFLTFLGLGAVLVKSVGGVHASYVQARIAGDVGGRLRLEVLEQLLGAYRVRGARHRDQGVAHGVAALTSHVREVETGLFAGVLGGLRAAGQLAPLLALLFVLAPKLAVAALLVFAPFSIALSSVRRRWKRANARAAREGEALLEAADESVRYADLWVTYGAEEKARAGVAKLGRALALRSARLEASAAALSGANEVLGAIALVCAIAAARVGWLGEADGGGRLLAFAVAFFLAYKPLRDLGDARLALARASAAYDRLRAPAEVERPAPPSDAPRARRSWALAPLEIKELALARGALGPISLTIGAGEIVCIAGPTGVGKTTLLRTLLGLDAARAGSILFGGEALDDADAGPDARPFAWVPQDAPLLADTLAANVALGGDAEAAAAALEPIGAADLARRVGDARLGTRRAVSGGERQWIALARAIATRQPVLLLDEPTSGLDERAQARVLEAIAKLRGERSIVLVTHRPEPLAVADRVVRLG